MQKKTHITWKVLLLIPESGPDYTKEHKFFNIKGGNSFINKMGGTKPGQIGFKPTVLEPTNLVYNVIRNLIKELDFKGSKLPFTTEKGETLNVNIRLYGPNVIILTVELSPVNVEDTLPLLDLKKISSHSNVYKLILHINSLIYSGNHKKYSTIGSLNSYSCLNIHNLSEEEPLLSDSEAVEALTGHEGISQEKINKIVHKNNQHNPYSTRLLIDKQGVFGQIQSNFLSNKHITSRFTSSALLLEYSIAISNLISSNAIEKLTEQEFESIQQAINFPTSIFVESVSVRKVWELLIGEFYLKEQLDHLLSAKQEYKATNLVEVVNDEKPIKDWSAKKIFKYSLLVTLVTTIAALDPIKDAINTYFETKQVSTTFPQEGLSVRTKTGEVILQWEKQKENSNYIVFIEYRNTVDNKWYPTLNGDRFTSIENRLKLELKIDRYYRWKIFTNLHRQEEVAKFSYSYFWVKNKLLPKKAKG